MGRGQFCRLHPTTSSAAARELPWQEHKDGEPKPGMSFLPVALLCPLRVLGNS